VRDGSRAIALAATLIVWSLVAPRMPLRWNPLPQAIFGVSIALLTRAPLGLSPLALWQGLRWGGSAAAPVLLAVAGGTAVPRVRAGMADRALPTQAACWLLLRIPVGTVWWEEVAYRAALGTVAKRAFGGAAGNAFTAAVFGLSHVPDARAAGEPVAGTVLVTGAAGWVFSWLFGKSGSLAAPMLAHLAVNEAGAIAALAVQRQRCGRARPDRAVRSSGRRSRS
jgi:membrane protease YdiL (CAAX protease family)